MKPSETSADEWAEKCFKVESFFEPHLNTTWLEGCQSVDWFTNLVQTEISEHCSWSTEDGFS